MRSMMRCTWCRTCMAVTEGTVYTAPRSSKRGRLSFQLHRQTRARRSVLATSRYNHERSRAMKATAISLQLHLPLQKKLKLLGTSQCKAAIVAGSFHSRPFCVGTRPFPAPAMRHRTTLQYVQGTCRTRQAVSQAAKAKERNHCCRLVRHSKCGLRRSAFAACHRQSVGRGDRAGP